MTSEQLIAALKKAQETAASAIRSALAEMPLRVRKHRAERWRLARIEEVLAIRVGWARLGRRPGHADRFTTEDLGSMLADARVLEDMALRQAWKRLSRYLSTKGGLDLS